MKYKYPSFKLLRVDGITLQLLKEEKYVGVTLESRMEDFCKKMGSENFYCVLVVHSPP